MNRCTHPSVVVLRSTDMNPAAGSNETTSRNTECGITFCICTVNRTLFYLKKTNNYIIECRIYNYIPLPFENLV